jgi:hypothetical protein
MMFKGLAATAALLIAAAHAPVHAEPVAQVSSPDGSTVVSLDTDNDKRVRYAVLQRNIAIGTRKVKKGDTLGLWLAPGGGAAIRLAAGD